MAAAGITAKKRQRTLLLSVLIGFPLLLYAGLLTAPWWVERGGTYDQTGSLADVDSDGDLDMILNVARTEAPGIVWAGIHLWTNMGDGQFTPSEPGIGGPSSAVGDVDLDGDPDLLIVEYDYLRLWLNSGGIQGGQAGQFIKSNPIQPEGKRRIPSAVVLGDLNGDGQIDGFVPGCCNLDWTSGARKAVPAPSKTWVWLNDWNPSGWLDRHTSGLPALDGVEIKAAALGDVDMDGDLDVFAAVLQTEGGGAASGADLILLNDGAGSFSDSGQKLGEGSSFSAALGDLDGDQDLDALVGTEGGADLWINQAGAQAGQAGKFTNFGSLPGSSQVIKVFLADFDADGDLDALLAGKRQADLWWNDGRTAFERSNLHFRYSVRHGLAVGDLNGDGTPDVIATAYSESKHVWLNQGDGKFQRQ